MAVSFYLDLLRDSLVNKHYQHLVTHEFSSKRWSKVAYTGIDVEGLNNIRECCEDVILNSVPGDFLEAGVWQGGASIFAAGVFKAHSQNDRRVLVLDSFQGMPKANFACSKETVDYSDLTGLAVSLNEVMENFSRFGVLEFAQFIPGWLKDTLPGLECPEIAVLRLDNDYYESTKLCIDHLYDAVSVGGWIIVDDYDCVPGCNTAIDEFLSSRRLSPAMSRVNIRTKTGVYWRKDQ